MRYAEVLQESAQRSGTDGRRFVGGRPADQFSADRRAGAAERVQRHPEGSGVQSKIDDGFQLQKNLSERLTAPFIFLLNKFCIFFKFSKYLYFWK